jgi:lysyl-tRNA synthetase class 2
MTTRSILELRARIRSRIRQFFDAGGYLEVDTPVLSSEVLPEPHIDPLPVALDGDGSPAHYLQASPEALMKRLLAAGSGPIYQFARSFRAGERGDRHDVEFVLLEWYGPGTTLADTAGMLEQLCRVTLGTSGLDRVGCTAAFVRHAGVDPLVATLEEMMAAVRRNGLELPGGTEARPPAEVWDRCFELLLAEVVTPRLGRGRPTMLEAWPVSQAAFAKIAAGPPAAAVRFELFVEGVELANGWEEEPCRAVLRERIDAANRIRVADGRPSLPVPRQLLAAHRGADGEPGGASMPEGVGGALGFDRLVMLAAGAATIDAVRCFTSRDA